MARPYLHVGLLALTFTLLAFADVMPNSSFNGTSPLDPFKEFRIHSAPKPSEPICCLIPLSSDPLPATAEYISFEEWKSKQLQFQAQGSGQTPLLDISEPQFGPSSMTYGSLSGDKDPSLPYQTEAVPSLSPHFRVPLTDRFNYASLDCSARVHTSHPSARSPSAILSSKKDRYMLSPCSESPKFVVVELCDDIRIDTVQLANFEFFSGVFRDFKVSVAQTYTADGQGWIDAGTYQAKNIRGVQSFHPVVELRPFFRFIRIDFLTHYGNEFYCPISLLRVYGLTQMEEWKWEVWQGGSDGGGAKVSKEAVDINKANDATVLDNAITTDGPRFMESRESREREIPVPMGPTQGQDEVVSSLFTSKEPTVGREVQGTPTTQLQMTDASVLETTSSEPSSSPLPSSSTSLEIITSVDANTASHTPSLCTSQETHNTSPLPDSSLTVEVPSSVTASNASQPTSLSSTPPLQNPGPPPSPNSVPSGESIYRTIMNRLTMLETNTTLYQKYVEEQNLQVRQVLRRLEENVGRLEGISKAQQHTFTKMMHDLERRRDQMEQERWHLLNQVNHLADEVILEKRLGIAQLCLLLMVLVFMALTRGSRTDLVSLLDDTRHRLNGFSRRSPWSSGDWTRKRWASRSPTPTPGDISATTKSRKREARSVTSALPLRRETIVSSPIPFPMIPISRPLTPRAQLLRPNAQHLNYDNLRPGSSERPVGRLRRSNSHTPPSHVYSSAKRLARSAHLHEVHVSRYSAKTSESEETQSEEDLGPGGSLKPRGDSVEHSSQTRLPAGSNVSSPLISPACGSSETGSWVDTETGSDPGNDSAGADSDEVGVQEKGYRLEKPKLRPSILRSPPSSLRRHLKSHPPTSPTSMTD